MRAALFLTLALSLLAGGIVPVGSVAASSDPTARSASSRHHAPAKVRPAQVALTPALTALPGVTVTTPPVGLSIEYSIMAQHLGAGACPPPALVAELLRLGSPALQLGGISQDWTAPSGALPSPPTSWDMASLYSLPPAFWSQLHCLLEATKDPLIVGLNLRTGNLAWATQIVAGAQSAATNGLSFSLGNEPDHYPLPNYSSLDKPAPGEEAAEASRYEQLAAYLRPAIGPAPLIGPELSRPADWRGQLPLVISQLHPQTVGVHLYPLTVCRTPRAARIKGLLAASVGNAPTRLKWVVATANAAGLPAIISEANSVSCGGRAGVSDSPAAAVWATRFVLSALKTGFREVRFHLAGDSYDPFVVRGGLVTTRPIENALVALKQWLPVGSTLRSVPGVRGLLATAIGEPSGAIFLVLDNEQDRPAPVVLRDVQRVNVEELLPAHAGVRLAALSSAHGLIRLSVPRNSLVVVSPTA
jgi:hypothetical protein